MLTVAIPVKRFHRVLGVLLVSVETTEIEEVVRQERLAILEVFGVALVMTAFLSLVLAGTIARPVRRLADFAYQVRQGRGREVKMPDFTNRRDEWGELSRALRDMTAALYMRIDAIEAFAADVAHELKNPLTSLHSAIETLEQTQQDDQRALLLRIIKDDVLRLDRLISDISNASRLDAELLRSEMEIVDVHNMLETIVSVYGSIDAEDSPTIVLNSENQPLAVTGIKEHLAQVIRNLIDNARSFNPPGEVVQLRTSKHHDKVVIEVEDRGPGISDDKLEVIFDRFYTERPEGDQNDSHSGLGLNICQQIIAVHGGEIWAENIYTDVDGERTCTGARFTISLPSAGPEGV